MCTSSVYITYIWSNVNFYWLLVDSNRQGLRTKVNWFVKLLVKNLPDVLVWQRDQRPASHLVYVIMTVI